MQSDNRAARDSLQRTRRSPIREELRGLISLGRDQGYLTFEQIASTLEEVDVTKEQVSQLHAHLIEHGVDVIAEDGVSAYKEAEGRRRPSRAAGRSST